MLKVTVQIDERTCTIEEFEGSGIRSHGDPATVLEVVADALISFGYHEGSIATSMVEIANDIWFEGDVKLPPLEDKPGLEVIK